MGEPGLHSRWVVAFGEFDDQTRAMYAWLAKVVNA